MQRQGTEWSQTRFYDNVFIALKVWLISLALQMFQENIQRKNVHQRHLVRFGLNNVANGLCLNFSVVQIQNTIMKCTTFGKILACCNASRKIKKIVKVLTKNINSYFYWKWVVRQSAHVIKLFANAMLSNRTLTK